MGPQLSTGSCRHHWLQGPAPSPPGKAGYLPPALLAETQPLFPAAARKSPRPSLPRGPCSLQISRSGNFLCAVFQASGASRTKARERQRPSSPFTAPSSPGRETQWTAVLGGTGSKSIGSSLTSSSSPAGRKHGCWPRPESESGLLRKASWTPQKRGLRLVSGGEAQVPELTCTWGKGYLQKKNWAFCSCS